jgi:hypothetical protein
MTTLEYDVREILKNIVIQEEKGFHRLGDTCEYIVGCNSLRARPVQVRWTAFPGEYCEYTRCRDCPEWLQRKLLEGN